MLKRECRGGRRHRTDEKRYMYIYIYNTTNFRSLHGLTNDHKSYDLTHMGTKFSCPIRRDLPRCLPVMAVEYFCFNQIYQLKLHIRVRNASRRYIPDTISWSEFAAFLSLCIWYANYLLFHKSYHLEPITNFLMCTVIHYKILYLVHVRRTVVL